MFKTFVEGDVVAADDLNAVMAQSVITFTDAADRDLALPAPTAGQLCYVAGTGVQLFDASNSWRTIATETTPAPFVPTSTFNRYAAVSTAQQFPGSSWAKVTMGNVITTTADWTYASSTYTCKTPGRYGISAFLRFNTGAAGHRGLTIADGNAYNVNVCAASIYYLPGADVWAETLFGERTFALNDTLSVWAFTTVNLMTPLGDLGLPYINIRQMV